jgi:E3 ubiquitin-protein ligase SHPRH
VYNQTLQQALDQLGLDARGIAAVEGWEPDTTVLRTWLRKLRGIATHPQVGQLQMPGDKLHRSGVLKTMAEVLEARDILFCSLARTSRAHLALSL